MPRPERLAPRERGAHDDVRVRSTLPAGHGLVPFRGSRPPPAASALPSWHPSSVSPSPPAPRGVSGGSSGLPCTHEARTLSSAATPGRPEVPGHRDAPLLPEKTARTLPGPPSPEEAAGVSRQAAVAGASTPVPRRPVSRRLPEGPGGPPAVASVARPEEKGLGRGRPPWLQGGLSGGTTQRRGSQDALPAAATLPSRAARSDSADHRVGRRPARSPRPGWPRDGGRRAVCLPREAHSGTRPDSPLKGFLVSSSRLRSPGTRGPCAHRV